MINLKCKIKRLYVSISEQICRIIPYPNINIDITISDIDACESIILTAVGDITLAYRFDKSVADPIFSPFCNVKELFMASSFVLANLEAPLTFSNDKLENKRYNFKSNPTYVKYLKDANINIVNLANNHIGDFGSEGVIDSIKILKENNIQYFGAGINSCEARNHVIMKKNNIRIAFLGYDDTCLQFLANSITPGVAFVNDKFALEIQAAKKEADIVCVSLHFGSESTKRPTDRQKVISKMAIDNGANVVVGHHPHVIQGFTTYKKGIIFYSLGNFCFGGNANPSDKDTFIASVIVQKDGIKKVNIIPCKISSHSNINDFTPKILKGNERNRILWKIKRRNKIL